MDALYHFAKWNFECGNYSAAAEYLYHYRTLSTNPERNVGAMWGKVAADILLQVGGRACRWRQGAHLAPCGSPALAWERAVVSA